MLPRSLALSFKPVGTRMASVFLFFFPAVSNRGPLGHRRPCFYRCSFCRALFNSFNESSCARRLLVPRPTRRVSGECCNPPPSRPQSLLVPRCNAFLFSRAVPERVVAADGSRSVTQLSHELSPPPPPPPHAKPDFRWRAKKGDKQKCCCCMLAVLNVVNDQ